MQCNVITYHDTAQAQNRKAAINLARNGYLIFPCDPATKRPMPGVKWRDRATSDLDRIKAWWDQWPEAMPALPTGRANGVSVIDLDVRPDKDGIAAYNDMGLDPNDSALIIRTAGGGLHLYHDHQGGVANTTGKTGIDVRGEGGYVIAPGAVSTTGEYTVEKGDITFARVLGLTPFPGVMASPAREPVTDQPAGDHNIEELRKAIGCIPNDGTHGDWVNILMALHHATGGSKHGLGLAHGWSAGYDGYSAKEVNDKWRGFGRKAGVQITADTLFAVARKHGYGAITGDSWDADDSRPSIDEILGDEPDADELPYLTPGQCAKLPPRDYVVKRLIAPGQVGCIFGEPGAGKSLLAPRLAYAVAQGEDAFGLRTRQGKVFYVACEDQDGMAHRLSALGNDLGSTDDFHLYNTLGDLFSPSLVEGKDKGSPDLVALCKAVKTHRPKLVVIDTLAMAMPGLEENDAGGMNRVVQIGKRLARYGAAVIFIHHGTKADGSTPRGHSVFNGALDFSIMVKVADKAGIVRTAIRKNRNGPPDLDIAFKIGSRHVGYDIDGEPLDVPICLPCNPGQADDSEPQLTKSEQAALNVVGDLAEDGPVNVDDWRKAAIDGYEVSGSDDRESRRKAVSRALTSLVQKGRVVVENDLISFPFEVETDDWDEESDE
ncbi:MAG: AAA family ATPase [Rhodobacteraceae bacterium]|nr:AAA family ATPase [Paracoccaceae bacterium]